MSGVDKHRFPMFTGGVRGGEGPQPRRAALRRHSHGHCSLSHLTRGDDKTNYQLVT